MKRILIILTSALTLIAAIIVSASLLHASSALGCISKTKEENKGRCVNDGTYYFCKNAGVGRNCVKGLYPVSVIDTQNPGIVIDNNNNVNKP